MKVTLIASTAFKTPGHVPWETERGGQYGSGADLVEFAGRACYQSWDRPNEKTAKNADYIAHIIEVGHNSVMEHATVTFYIEDVSRSLTHELVRHRAGFSYSQLSQRFVDESQREAPPVIPPIFAGEKVPEDAIRGFHAASLNVYDMLVEQAIAKGATRKQAREAARSVLPNASETKIVVTANMTAWRHFFTMRGSIHADAEIRELALRLIRLMWWEAGLSPFFQDFEERTNEKGQDYLAHVNDPKNGNGK